MSPFVNNCIHVPVCILTQKILKPLKNCTVKFFAFLRNGINKLNSNESEIEGSTQFFVTATTTLKM
jgi:hypothetical protein